ncbi:MAG TPA: M20 family metallopeptidase [Thermomicrobiales bacterium]|nr:M20 family metallopeptidase [Thermomicrobiales bacterium]
MIDGEAIVRLSHERQDATMALLRRLVEFESPTSDKPAMDRLIDFLEAELRKRGGQVERLPQVEYGDLVVARFGSGQKPLHVMTHVDTVWPIGTIERMPWRIEGDHAHGPGIYDMKASAAMMFTALDILRDLDISHRPIVWTINTEEEVGSPVSRPVLETEARQAEMVLCLEPPVPPHGSLKTERKGVGMFEMEIEGRAAHAGADHSAGISAIEELARQIQWLHGFTDYDKGTTVNVGVVEGGTKRNVVAAYASALIDLRVTSVTEAERVVPAILGATAQLDGATVRVTGEMNRPPMERTDGIIAAFQRAREIGRLIEQNLTEASTGGGSDGNFTAAIGAPTLDGLGCPGDGGHADNEHIIVSEVAPRTALITALLAEL